MNNNTRISRLNNQNMKSDTFVTYITRKEYVFFRIIRRNEK